MIVVWRFSPEQIPDQVDIGGAIAVSEEAVMADAVLAFWQHMDEETPNAQIPIGQADPSVIKLKTVSCLSASPTPSKIARN